MTSTTSMTPTTWANGPLASFDLETTGFSSTNDALVQAACLIVGPDGEVLDGSWTSVINPGRPIPIEAIRVHGITDARARREGMAHDEAVERVLRYLDDVARAAIPLVIFNAPFDLGFIRAAAARQRLPIAAPVVVDPLAIHRVVDPHRPERKTLTALAAYYRCTALPTHDARADALAAAAVARALARAHPVLASTPAGELYRIRETWQRA